MQTALRAFVLAAGLLATPPIGEVAPPPSISKVQGAGTVRVFLVRHGEAEAEGAEVALTPIGQARARCLVETLKDQPVTHLFTSPRRRAQQTLAPLAAARGLEQIEREPLPAAALASELAALPPSSVAVVVGHSNTLPPLVQALGGALGGLVEEAGQPALPRDEHDRLVVVRLRAGGDPGPRLLDLAERRYACAETSP